MQINLSKATIETVYETLKVQDSFLVYLLGNETVVEKREQLKDRIVEVRDVLLVFEELRK